MDINVAPDMGMYNLLKSQGYETSHALAEYIDNAIHAWQLIEEPKTTLKVSIKFFSQDYKNKNKKNSIIIADNGPGITRESFVNAFKPAKPPSTKGLSEFGIGMKAASVWFSDSWSLISQPKGEKKYIFDFDLEKLIENGSDTVTVKEVQKSNQADTGIAIILRDLRKPIDKEKVGDICNELGEIYRKFTFGEDPILELTAELDDTPIGIKYEAPDRTVLTSPIYKKYKDKLYAIGDDIVWKEGISFKFAGCSIYGFIQLLSKSSTKSNPGLTLFRHNRVISGTSTRPYIPEQLFKTANKFSKQRVYGELHLDGIAVSYTKDKFEFDEKQFVSKIAEIDEVKKFFKQSETYRAKSKPKKVKTEAEMRRSANGEANKPSPKENSKQTNVSNARTNSNKSSQSGKLDTKKPTCIPISQDIINLLNKLASGKLTNLYNSLTKLTFDEHPSIICIGAWAFFETISRNMGASESTSFDSFLNSKVNSWFPEKSQKKSIKQSLSFISNEGNCNKHCNIYYTIEATPLAVHFEILEPLVIKALEDILKTKDN